MRFRRLPAGAGTAVELCVTDRHDGDFRIDAPADELAERRRDVFDGAWTWLRQVHGSDVALVDSPGGCAGTDADAAVTGLLGAVLCVQTADCVPIVVVGEHAVGVIHAGWRGLVAGVVDRGVEALRTIGSSPLQAVIGPCIRPGHYEFGADELARSRPPSAAPAAARRPPVPSPSTWLRDHACAAPSRCRHRRRSRFRHRRRALFSHRVRAMWAARSRGSAGDRMTPVDPAVVAERAATVRARLDAAGGADVRIVAVTKTFGPSAVDAAVAAGLGDVGENYAQEAAAKLSEISSAPTVHFIGRLQRNKVRLLAPHVDVWQTVDRPELATEIAKRAPGAKVMIQVDISGEESKGGCSPDTTEDLVMHATDAGLEVIGLMGVALLAEPQAARPGFSLLRGLVDRLDLDECSMGMSADLEIAVDEGATMVRIGRDLFGERLG